jgi:hypothetical protein
MITGPASESPLEETLFGDALAALAVDGDMAWIREGAAPANCSAVVAATTLEAGSEAPAAPLCAPV